MLDSYWSSPGALILFFAIHFFFFSSNHMLNCIQMNNKYDCFDHKTFVRTAFSCRFSVEHSVTHTHTHQMNVNCVHSMKNKNDSWKIKLHFSISWIWNVSAFSVLWVRQRKNRNWHSAKGEEDETKTTTKTVDGNYETYYNLICVGWNLWNVIDTAIPKTIQVMRCVNINMDAIKLFRAPVELVARIRLDS